MNAYRTPRDPGGFPFGYDWRSTLVGFIALTLINAGATQYVASRFRYQEALGKPLVKNNQFAIYQPFAWSVWGFRNCTSRDERVRKPLFEAEIGVFGGSMISLLIFVAAANRRARQLSENAEDLHGSARWAKPEDIDATGLATCREGVYVGGW